MSVTELLPGLLWMSGLPDVEDALMCPSGPLDDADLVVCLTREPPPVARDGQAVLWWPIKDGPLPDAPTLVNVAAFLGAMLYDDRRVYVYCDAGINRSGLLAALAMRECLAINGAATNGASVLVQVRAARGEALTNPTFAAYLEQLP